MPAPTLEFAAICLRNALFLLPPFPGEERPPQPAVTALPGPPIQGNDIITLRLAQKHGTACTG